MSSTPYIGGCLNRRKPLRRKNLRQKGAARRVVSAYATMTYDH
jgi:hypothetical protein